MPADIRLKMNGGGVRINIRGSGVVRTIGAFIIATLIFFIGWFGVAGITRSINENAATKTQAGLPILLAVTPTSPLPTQTPYYPPTSTPQITPTATETPTAPLINPSNPLPPPVACGRPAGWVGYTIRPNDTLSALGRSFGVTVAQLQSANCLGSSTILHVGTILYVPPWAAIPVVPTLEPTWPVPVDIPTNTPTPEPTATVYEPPFVSSTPNPTDTQPIIPTEPVNP